MYAPTSQPGIALLIAVLLVLIVPFHSVQAAPQEPPTGKFYVVDVTGSARLHRGDDQPILELAVRSVHKAEGAAIETGPASSAVLLFSNGTSLACSEQVRLRVVKFDQESINSMPKDLDTEPSVSKVVFMVEKGKVGLSVPELLPGSSQVILTPEGQVNLRGSRLMIDVRAQETVVSVIAGDVTARTRSLDGGSLLRTGTQGTLSSSMNQQAQPIQMQSISAAQFSVISLLIAESEMARKSVTFAPVGGTASSSGPGTGTLFGEEKTEKQELQPVVLMPATFPSNLTVSPSRLRK